MEFSKNGYWIFFSRIEMVFFIFARYENAVNLVWHESFFCLEWARECHGSA